MTGTRLEGNDRVASQPPERPDEPEALFEEARRRRRRRRRIVCGATLCLLVGALAAGLAVSGAGGGRSAPKTQHHTTPAAPPAAPPTAAQQQPGAVLPSSALFNQISETSSGLLLSGVTKAAGENPQGPCAVATLDPESLAVGNVNVGNCDNPRLFGQTVEPVTNQAPSNNVNVSVSVVSPTTGTLTDGHVVMTYEYSSDTHLVTAYGPKSLWIYDVATTNGAELLQVSARSGAVVDVVPMPKLYRPLLAADDGGIWVANSIEGSPGPALSYVVSGASTPTTVVADTGSPICWLTASGTSAWVGAGDGWNCGNQMVQKYVDGAPGPVYSTPGAGFAPSWVVGDTADGLWAMQWSQAASPGASSSQQIISINPDTGTESVVATTPPVVYPNGMPTNGLVQGQAVFFHGAHYLLEPPFREDGYLGYTSIVRVPVSSPGN